MMQIVYFSQKAQFLTEIDSISGERIFVTPSPAKADNLRSQLGDKSNQDVITIAKFTSDLLKELWSDEERPSVKRKAELLLIFGILKNKYLPSLGFEQFLEAYNLFSDLRSFTLNEDALASVLEEQAGEIKEAVQLFWKLLNLTGYLDEHAAYHSIAEVLRSREEISSQKKTYIFWGFQHLNGQQVDLIKALAIRSKVIIPFPAALGPRLKRSDWISWLKEYKVEEKFLKQIEQSSKAKWLPVNSREISLQLKKHLVPSSVVLGVSKLSAQHLEIIPHESVGFKVPHNLLSVELMEIADAFNEELGESATTEDFNTWLQQKKIECLKPHKYQMPFKRLKALQLFEETFATIAELTDEVLPLDYFFKKLVKEVAQLNQPRTSYTPLLKDKAEVELRDMSSLEDIDRTKPVFLCIDERFDEIQSLGQNYSESIQKELSALGPLKRNELELLFKQWEFKDLFSTTDVTVLMSESVLKHSVIWKKLFSDIVLDKIISEPASSSKQVEDFFKNQLRVLYSGHFSASRLQSYLDCPRKFYYQYVEKISPSISLERDIDALISGSIIHNIIEEYFKRILELKDLKILTKELFDKVIKEKQLRVPHEVYLQREIIFNQRSLNGIQFLKDLEGIVKDPIDWKIEQDFLDENQFKLLGKIDCLGISSKHIFLLDFKSSEASASSFTDVEKFESLQLWVYALAAKKIIPDFHLKSIVMGYVVLDDSSKSNLLFGDDELFDQIKAAKICKTKKFDESFLTILEEANKKLQETVKTVLADTSFKAQPRKIKDCVFCELAPVCPKGEEYV